MRRLSVKGFTLVELLLALVIMGIMVVGISNLIVLSGQVYVDVRDRDALLSDARFVVERINRELREAVPNSSRVLNTGAASCLEFVPLVATSIYVDIPVLPDAASDQMSVVRITNYQCDSDCSDQVIVYPLETAHVYDADENRRVGLDTAPDPTTRQDITGDGNDDAGYVITLDDDTLFAASSPTERFFIVNQPVSFCAVNNQIWRYSGYGYNVDQAFPPAINGVLMADNLGNDLADVNDLPFLVDDASLRRNGLVNVLLKFYRDATILDEPMVFNLEVDVANVP